MVVLLVWFVSVHVISPQSVGDVPVEQLLEQCAANLQVASSNPAYARICWMFFQVVIPQPYVLVVTREMYYAVLNTAIKLNNPDLMYYINEYVDFMFIGILPYRVHVFVIQ